MLARLYACLCVLGLDSSNLCRLSLDTMRVDSRGGEVKAAVCYAAYGYMGGSWLEAVGCRIWGFGA